MMTEPNTHYATASRNRLLADGMPNATHLTFVSAVVAFLHVFNLQIPVVTSLCVHNLEPLVVCVREDARCQDVPVSPPDPRHLRNRKENYELQYIFTTKSLRFHDIL